MKRGHFIYITGCDGTGKTTQTELLVKQLQAQGVRARHLWLRFPFLFSLPLLAYARLRGYSWYEVTNGVRHGYWDFRRSRLMRRIFPWVLLLDAAIAALWAIYLPLWRGETVVCERFVLDMLVDLGVAAGEPEFYIQWPGRLYWRLLPQNALVFVLDLDVMTIRTRRADLTSDRRLADRVEAFRALALTRKLKMISSAPPVMEVNRLMTNN